MVNLVTANADMLPGVYNFNIVATPTGSYSGVTPGTFTQACSVTVGSSGGAIPVTPPTAIATSGYTLVFFDDFTNASTVNPAGYVFNSTWTSGVNWYVGSSPISTTQTSANYAVMTTTAAAGISNGNSGGGANASSAGGLFKILGSSQLTDNGNWSTAIPHSPAASGQIWKYGYYEAYIQYNWTANANNGNVGGWPAWWSFTNNNPSNSTAVEYDFMEDQGNGPYWTISDPGGGVKIVGTGDIIAGATPNGDSNWHTYGTLWKTTATGRGVVAQYYDNVLVNTNVTSVVTTGTGNTVPDFDFTTGMYLVLGTGSSGLNIPMYVDWVRVWQPAGAITQQPVAS